MPIFASFLPITACIGLPHRLMTYVCRSRLQTVAFALQIYAAAGMSVSKISGQKFFLIWKIEG